MTNHGPLERSDKMWPFIYGYLVPSEEHGLACANLVGEFEFER